MSVVTKLTERRSAQIAKIREMCVARVKAEDAEVATCSFQRKHLTKITKLYTTVWTQAPHDTRPSLHATTVGAPLMWFYLLSLMAQTVGLWCYQGKVGECIPRRNALDNVMAG